MGGVGSVPPTPWGRRKTHQTLRFDAPPGRCGSCFGPRGASWQGWSVPPPPGEGPKRTKLSDLMLLRGGVAEAALQFRAYIAPQGQWDDARDTAVARAGSCSSRPLVQKGLSGRRGLRGRLLAGARPGYGSRYGSTPGPWPSPLPPWVTLVLPPPNCTRVHTGSPKSGFHCRRGQAPLEQ